MTVIIREDGAKFVLQSYREQFDLKNVASLKNELRSLAATNGQFARFFTQAGTVEAVYSNESGYLLGETVWNYFSKPQNLIYCEKLEGGAFALLIVVRKGSLLFDKKIPIAHLEQELAALFSENIRYVIKGFGDLSINPNKECTYEKLAKPIFPLLPCKESLNLLPIEQALQSVNLKERHFLKWGVGLAAVVFIGFAIFLSKPMWDKNAKMLSTVNESSITDQLIAISMRINSVSAFPGWMLSDVTYQPNKINLTMKSYGGTTADLRSWAKDHHSEVTLTNHGADVTESILFKAAKKQAALFNSQETLSFISDRMINVLPSNSISVSETRNGETAMAIDLKDISPEILEMIAKQLVDLPLTLQGVTIHVNNGLLSGQIKLTVIGKG